MTRATASLPDFIAAMEEVSRDVDESFGKLSAEQLNWKANPESWSIGQCIEHLIKTNTPYIPLIESARNPSRKSSLWEKVPVLPGLFGNLLANAVSPEAARKLKAPDKFQPTASAVSSDVIATFQETQKKLLELMKSTSSVDLAHTIVTSPAIAVITYSLLDGYRIISNHEQRHLLQAKRVMSTNGFPRA